MTVMNDQPQTHDEQYQKVHDHLLGTNQQELAGHLDTLWQELGRLRAIESRETKLIEASTEEEAAQPDDTDNGASGWGFKPKK